MREILQERARATRRSLLEAAAFLFAQQGYAGTSVNDISARSGRTSGSVYFHYASKEGIAQAVVREGFATWPSLVARYDDPSVPPLERLVALSHDIARALAEDALTRAAPACGPSATPSTRTSPTPSSSGRPRSHACSRRPEPGDAWPPVSARLPLPAPWSAPSTGSAPSRRRWKDPTRSPSASPTGGSSPCPLSNGIREPARPRRGPQQPRRPPATVRPLTRCPWERPPPESDSGPHAPRNTRRTARNGSDSAERMIPALSRRIATLARNRPGSGIAAGTARLSDFGWGVRHRGIAAPDA